MEQVQGARVTHPRHDRLDVDLSQLRCFCCWVGESVSVKWVVVPSDVNGRIVLHVFIDLVQSA
jgi:hypothetical protein